MVGQLDIQDDITRDMIVFLVRWPGGAPGAGPNFSLLTVHARLSSKARSGRPEAAVPIQPTKTAVLC